MWRTGPKSPEKRLRMTAKLARQIYDAEKGLIDIIQGASVVATEFKELEKTTVRQRILNGEPRIDGRDEQGVGRGVRRWNAPERPRAQCRPQPRRE